MPESPNVCEGIHRPQGCGRRFNQSSIQAFVGEAASLQYYDKAHPELPITEVGPIFNDEKYAFGLPKKSDLRTELNIELLILQEVGFLHDLQVRYFGDS